MNGNGNGSSASIIGGLLAPARSSHSRAVSLPAFAAEAAFEGGLGAGLSGLNGGAIGGGRRGHAYQSSYGGFGGLGVSGLSIQEGRWEGDDN